jgi:hypothetical protein
MPRLQAATTECNILFARLDRAPGRQNRNRAQQRRQHHQQKADAVNAQRVLRADQEGIHSAVLYKLKLRCARSGLKAPDQRQRNQQPEKSEQVAHPTMQVGPVARNKKHQNRADQRREQDRA